MDCGGLFHTHSAARQTRRPPAMITEAEATHIWVCRRSHHAAAALFLFPRPVAVFPSALLCLSPSAASHSRRRVLRARHAGGCAALSSSLHCLPLTYHHICPAAEYCARGSLADVLRAAKTTPAKLQHLTWLRRLNMALDATKGMLYL